MLEKKYLILLGYSLFFISGVLAQQSTLATGDNANGVGGFVSYSIGQLFYTTNFSATNFIIQGVQQPFEIYSNGNNKFISLEYTIYPNPTVDFLTLNIINFNHHNLSYKLYDTNGKLIINIKLSESKTKIEVKYLRSAIYYLIISNDLKVLKTFKIIKN